MLIRLDTYLFKQFYYFASRNPLVEKVMVLFTNWSSKIFYLFYISFILFLIIQGNEKIIPFIFGPASGFVLAMGMRRLWKRERPFAMLKVPSLIPHGKDYSFPSMHASSAFVIAASMWHISRSIGAGVLLLAGLTSLSRVMVGVHYPLDILVGCALGVFISTVTFSII